MEAVKDLKELSDAEFIKKCEGLVHYVVKERFSSSINTIERNTGLDKDDLTQIGFIGLLKARDHFDPSYGFAFATYSIPKIHGEILRYLRDTTKLNVSRKVKELKVKIFNAGLLEEPPEKIASILEVTVEAVKEAINYDPGYAHYNQMAVESDNKKVEFLDTLCDNFNLCDHVSNNSVVQSFLYSELDERERKIWYLYNVKELEQAVIGRMLGVSQMTISRYLRKINSKAAMFGQKIKMQGVC